MVGKKKNRNKSLGGLALMIIMLVAAALLVVCYISGYLNPAKSWLLTIFGIIYLPLFFINALLLIWALIRRYIYFIIPLVALLPSIFWVGRYYQFRKESDEEGVMKVMSYNVGHFELSPDELSQRESFDSIVRLVDQEQPDIVLFQEFCTLGGHDTASFIDENFKGYGKVYYAYDNGANSTGNVILTKFPILEKGVFDFEESANLAIYCDCEINGERIRIYNCHFQSYSISLSRMAADLRVNYEETMKNTEKKFKTGISMRPKQVDQIMEDILKSPYKSLIGGDFNDTPMSYTYNKIMRYQKDSFKEAGCGFGSTYSVLWPLLRIDYILYPTVFEAVSHRTLKENYSDHYPIVASFDYIDSHDRKDRI